MLSIGKLGVGQADYYLQAVGQGIEDYYAGTGEAPGRWLGTAATELALAGQVDADQLRSVLNGNRPDGSGPLTRAGQGTSRVPGFDLTFSAPKSVSLLFGLGDEHVSRAARDAHEAAVDAALEYMERHAALGRRGKGGAISVLGNGFIGAGFRHRTSRAGDPQLHTHVLVANMTRGPDGRWTALDARRLYTHARTGGFLYQAKLRLELTRRLGVEWTPVRNGVAEVDGIPAGVRRAFSRRRAEIEAELEQRGEHTPAAAQVAALHTRRERDYNVPADQLRERWQDRAAQLDFPPAHVGHATRQTEVTPLTREAADQGQEHLASPDGLTRRQSSFTRRDAVRAWCEQLPHGGDVEQIEALADELLTGQAVVLLLPDASSAPIGDVVRRADGRLVAAGSEERRYSTPELLALEHEILDTFRDGRHRDRAAVTPATTHAVLAAHPELSSEQATMVDRLLQDGDAIAVVVGRAGTGKTYALAAAREGWQAEGHQVIGAALARRASLELRDGAGIDATSLHALLADLRDRPGELLSRPTVLVVDEAGMVGTRQLAEVVQHATRYHAKVVLVGDPRQLPEIDAGGSFRALTVRGDPIVLADNRRQREQWERDALEHLRSGHADRALDRYAEHDRLTIADTAPELRDRLVADWWQARETGADAIVIALRRDDISDLNARARARMRHHDRIGPDALHVGGKHFATGDQAVCLRNHPGLGVTNGTHGTITAINDEAVTLVDRAGREYMLTTDYLGSTTQRGGPVLDHGYALTGHKAQGLTVDQAFVLGSDQLYREWGYVAMSRGRHANRLYIVNAHDDRDLAVAHAEDRKPPPLDAVTRALARSAAQTSATDAALEASIAALSTPALQKRLADTTRDDAATQRRARRDRALADRGARRGSPAATPEPTPAPPAESELIADELARRRTRDTAAKAADPPRYLLDALGPVPESLLAQRSWRARAQRIEDLRRTTAFDDPKRALPDRVPVEHHHELEEIRRQFDPSDPPRVPDSGRSPER
ncbi:MAG TPA: MobF family relaxase [Solirubrobacteraceae bacterium]|jgi:conjugative relaxase-like TrwC/TraI family protein|nr:MobF family relaxase [Solirubrobacteraceae bacterium]